jgi:SWIB/MDM2 domain
VWPFSLCCSIRGAGTSPPLLRLGDKPKDITITFVREFAPEYMLVRGDLAKALNLKAGTRGRILRKLWTYVKAHSQADQGDPAYVDADDELFALFSERRLLLSTLGRRMEPFLSTPKPVVLHHKLVLDGPSPCTPLTVDMEVAWSLKPYMLQLPAFLERFDARPLIEEQDRRINGAQPCSKHSVNSSAARTDIGLICLSWFREMSENQLRRMPG